MFFSSSKKGGGKAGDEGWRGGEGRAHLEQPGGRVAASLQVLAVPVALNRLEARVRLRAVPARRAHVRPDAIPNLPRHPLRRPPLARVRRHQRVEGLSASTRPGGLLRLHERLTRLLELLGEKGFPARARLGCRAQLVDLRAESGGVSGVLRLKLAPARRRRGTSSPGFLSGLLRHGGGVRGPRNGFTRRAHYSS
jgi:hypothetical protein